MCVYHEAITRSSIVIRKQVNVKLAVMLFVSFCVIRIVPYHLVHNQVENAKKKSKRRTF